MNYNKAYQKAYEFRKKFWYIGNDFMWENALGYHLSQEFQPMREKLYQAKFKSLYPRRKVPKWDKLWFALTEDQCEAIDAPIREKSGRMAKQIIKNYYKLNDLMSEWASKVDLTAHGEMRVVKKSDTGTYSTQGWGAEQYAFNALKSPLNTLTQADYKAEIWPVTHDENYKAIILPNDEMNALQREKRPKQHEPYSTTGFALMCCLDEWQFDAVMRLSEKTILDLAVECWRTGANPRVLYPSISAEISRQASEIAFGT